MTEKTVYVYVAPVDDFSDNRDIPDYTVAEIARLTAAGLADEKRAVYGLLKAALNESFGIKTDFSRFSKNSCGKPVADGFHFSISHSQRLVAVAVARSPVGVDIQSAFDKPTNAKLLARISTDREKAAVREMNGDKINKYLFELWTVKEAAFKLDGQTAVFRPEKIAAAEIKHKTVTAVHDGVIYYISVAVDNRSDVRFVFRGDIIPDRQI